MTASPQQRIGPSTREVTPNSLQRNARVCGLGSAQGPKGVLDFRTQGFIVCEKMSPHIHVATCPQQRIIPNTRQETPNSFQRNACVDLAVPEGPRGSWILEINAILIEKMSPRTHVRFIRKAFMQLDGSFLVLQGTWCVLSWVISVFSGPLRIHS